MQLSLKLSSCWWRAVLRAGQGVLQRVLVTVGSQVSSFCLRRRGLLTHGSPLSRFSRLQVSAQRPVYFNYTAPAVSLVLPATGPTLGGVTLTLTGALA
jgi:hypothetical protein